MDILVFLWLLRHLDELKKIWKLLTMFLCMEIEINSNIKLPTGKVWAIKSTKKWMIAARTQQRVPG